MGAESTPLGILTYPLARSDRLRLCGWWEDTSGRVIFYNEIL